ncbi:amino acid permease, partial [Kyrpidia sp.]|uniref:amino acid permease n=1 Tax=Kyrpidia sp. TaxID=2073077 RepID=UPI002586368C
TKSVILRTLLFFVGSIFLIVVILPWNDTVLLKSPFVSALERLRVPGAAAIMNFVVITAVLSCLNSALYAASRMLYSLAIHGDAPSILHKVNEKGVPVWAVLASTLFGYVSIILDYISPDKAFLFLINTSGSVALYMWLIIALSELKLRKKLELEAPERLHVRMWGYPYLTILTIVIILVVLFSMAFMESTRSQFWMGILSLSVVLGLYMLRKRRSDREETQGAGTDFSA